MLLLYFYCLDKVTLNILEGANEAFTEDYEEYFYIRYSEKKHNQFAVKVLSRICWKFIRLRVVVLLDISGMFVL